MIKRYRSASIIKKRRKALYIRFSILVIVLAIVLGSISYLSNLERFQVRNLTIKGAATASEAVIRSIVETQTAGAYFFLFSKNNVVLYPKTDIETEIATEYKQIKTIELDAEGKQNITITIEERTPYALWCTEASTLDSCYFIDDTGYIYTKAPSFSGTAFFKYFGGVEGEPLGTTFRNKAAMLLLEDFVAKLKLRGIEVVGLTVEKEGEYIAHLKEGGKILFNDDEGLDTVIDNIVLVFTKDNLKTSDLSTLDYLNMRFGKKVFFKFK